MCGHSGGVFSVWFTVSWSMCGLCMVDSAVDSAVDKCIDGVVDGTVGGAWRLETQRMGN